jgi:hypothetical protein
MTRLGIATAVLAIALCMPAAAQGTPPLAPDETTTLPQLDVPQRVGIE